MEDSAYVSCKCEVSNKVPQRHVVYNPGYTLLMLNTALQIHRGEQRCHVIFIGCSQTELALYNLESNSLSTHCNISLFLLTSYRFMNSEPSVLAAAAAHFVWFWFGGLDF